MAFTEKYGSILEQRRAALIRQLELILPKAGTDFVWEVGSGHGHFLTAYASVNPERLCIGIDLVGERIDRAIRKRDRAKLSNLHFIRAEARFFLETLPPAHRLGAIFVLFPDPWPKLRHNKHRIIQPSFLSAAGSHSVPGCPLYFRTDFEPYFAAARATVGEHPDWELTDEPWPFEYATVFQQRADTFHSLVARCQTPSLRANSGSAVENAG
jgi:tRNA (guanine-N7-)-methyltransferase